MSSYSARLSAAIGRTGNPVCVGLDPRWNNLPAEIRERATAAGGNLWEQKARGFEEFSRRIIDVVAGLVPVVKPQAAFFEECGPAGVAALWRVMRHARQAGLLVICDAKRGDIGSTAEAYAQAYLGDDGDGPGQGGVDALTINPYLGADTLQPFVDAAVKHGRGLYVLVRTSNPGPCRTSAMPRKRRSINTWRGWSNGWPIPPGGPMRMAAWEVWWGRPIPPS
jgi:orotidine-5'-phosphate decarboxylase